MKSRYVLSQPGRPLRGEMIVPGDKSISHRAVILGSIAIGTTKIEGFLEGQDCMATVSAFRGMGVSIECPKEGQLIIHGVGKNGLKPPESPIDCQNSGTTMRLMAGLLAAQPFNSILTGDTSLQLRPMERISKPLRMMGAKIFAEDGRAPLLITGNQHLKGISYTMPQASAQVKSGLLFAGLYADGETTLIEPLPSRDHTERMLDLFSCPVVKSGNTISLNSKQECIGSHVPIPGDISSAAFFIVAATLVSGSSLWIRRVGVNSGRIGVIHILQSMGAKIDISNISTFGNEPIADIYIESANLKGIHIPASQVPHAIDELPILCIAAACAEGITTMEGVGELRFKESDRISAMVNGLRVLGIDISASENTLSIKGGTLQGGTVDGLSDHRIAMSFAIAGQLAKCSVKIQNCDKIDTSLPNFFSLATTAGMDIQEIKDDQ